MVVPYFGRLTVTTFVVAVVCAKVVAFRAQDPGHGVTPAELERGGQTFLQACASCHGQNGDGVPTVNLASGSFRRASTDQDLVNLIRLGIPGSAMPPSNLSDAQAALVVAYLRSLPGVVAASKASGLNGNAARGKTLYVASRCSSCHMIDGQGGFLGPDLSSVGTTRRVDELERSLTNPSVDIRNGSRTVSVVLKDGTSTTGRLLNQDTYSLQFIDAAGRLTAVQKDAVRRWEVMETSAMPGVGDKLTPQEIADLVGYLQSLTAPVRTGGVAGTGRGGGIAGPPPAGGARGRGGAQ